MRYSSDNIGQQDLDAVVDSATAIYREHDKKRTLWDIWCHALHHASGVAEEVRKDPVHPRTNEKMICEIADFALWIFTMLVKLKGAIGVPKDQIEAPQDCLVRISAPTSELMWNRYPGICPWCYFARHADGAERIPDDEFLRACTCDQLEVAREKKDAAALRARAKKTRLLAKQHVDRRPKSLEEWQQMFRAIYSARLSRASLENVALHLMEEMGEVSDGLIRMYAYKERELETFEDEIVARQARLEDELADVLSWLFGLVERIDADDNDCTSAPSSEAPKEPSPGRLNLSQLLWTKYGSEEKHQFWCRHCKQVDCRCSIQLVLDRALVGTLAKRLNS